MALLPVVEVTTTTATANYYYYYCIICEAYIARSRPRRWGS